MPYYLITNFYQSLFITRYKKHLSDDKGLCNGFSIEYARRSVNKADHSIRKFNRKTLTLSKNFVQRINEYQNHLQCHFLKSAKNEFIKFNDVKRDGFIARLSEDKKKSNILGLSFAEHIVVIKTLRDENNIIKQYTFFDSNQGEILFDDSKSLNDYVRIYIEHSERRLQERGLINKLLDFFYNWYSNNGDKVEISDLEHLIIEEKLCKSRVDYKKQDKYTSSKGLKYNIKRISQSVNTMLDLPELYLNTLIITVLLISCLSFMVYGSPLTLFYESLISTGIVFSAFFAIKTCLNYVCWTNKELPAKNSENLCISNKEINLYIDEKLIPLPSISYKERIKGDRANPKLNDKVLSV